ncbi:T9SS type A sorting domain-containing protein [Flavobacterium nackdongense]|uniref:T9SS type A sorting domain-containing protein n=1 Tax=Flavobacterium nackdongense TaxID=2547394 RepID=A0A4P6YBF6_9FLAO|nr:T9SS type A sorting domain-containing protein [Flavobacterium nackdongense]QBN20456.1 T9SS type A sorting domain-containing protein [Flavobacterium nackdongense]
MKKITLFLLMLSSSVGFAQLVTNSTFDTATTGWAYNAGTAGPAGGSIGYSATEGFTAPGAMVLVAGGSPNRVQTSPNVAPTFAGDYKITAKVKGTAGTTVTIQVFQGAPGSTTGSSAFTMTGGWDAIEFTKTGMVTSATAGVRIVAGSAGTFYIDDVYFTYQIPAGNTTLTTNVVGSGTVTKTPNQGSYLPTDMVTVSAINNTHWIFSNWSGDLSGTSPSANITMNSNKTVTANFVSDPSFDYSFDFLTDGNLEGWTLDPQITVSTHTGGLVTLAPTANQFARLNLLGFPIPTDPMAAKKCNKVTVVIKNGSATTNELAVVVGTIVSGITPITTNDAAYQTYEIDLTKNTAWTGDVTSFKLRFADSNNTANAGKPSDSGSIILDNIRFTYDGSLGLDAISKNNNSIALYPNPAKDVLNISSASKVISVDVYDSTGRLVLKSDNKSNDQINVSDLQSGIYIVRLKNADNSIEDKKLVITK